MWRGKVHPSAPCRRRQTPSTALPVRHRSTAVTPPRHHDAMDQPLEPPTGIGRVEQRTCEWCNRTFYRRTPIGRRPRFCRPACRTRASECRRGLRRGNAPWYPTPRTLIPAGHSLGIAYVRDPRVPDLRRRQHALLTGAPIDQRARALTMCGTYAYAVGGRFPQVPTTANCKTCLRMTRGPNSVPKF
jgi:hypothetical protein